MGIQSILSRTHLLTDITLVTETSLHVLGLNMVCDVVALSGLVVADETEERVSSQLLHMLLQGALHIVVV